MTSRTSSQVSARKASPSRAAPAFSRPAASLASAPLALQRKAHCACGGSCPRCQAQSERVDHLQTKLTVNSVGDSFEQEADRMAEAVMRMPATEKGEAVQGAAVTSGAHVQAKPAGAGGLQVTPQVSADIAAMRGGGEPLPPSVRSFFEPRFGQDFGQVRVHHDARSARSAWGVNASAFTIGHDIAFSEGAYAPDTDAGKRLLAHELTHVVQQAGTACESHLQRKDLSDPEKAAAVTFNQALISRIYTIGVLRVTVGLTANPAKLDESFAVALATWQEGQGLTATGKLDTVTAEKLVVALIDPHPRDAIVVAMDAFELASLGGLSKTGNVDFIRVNMTKNEENCCFERGKPQSSDSDAVTHGGAFDPNAKNRGGDVEICFCLENIRPKVKKEFTSFLRILAHELVHVPQHKGGIGSKKVMDQALYEFEAYFSEVCNATGLAPQYPPARRKGFARSAVIEYAKIDRGALPADELRRIDAEKALLDKLRGMRDQDIKPVPCNKL